METNFVVKEVSLVTSGSVVSFVIVLGSDDCEVGVLSIVVDVASVLVETASEGCTDVDSVVINVDVVIVPDDEIVVEGIVVVDVGTEVNVVSIIDDVIAVDAVFVFASVNINVHHLRHVQLNALLIIFVKQLNTYLRKILNMITIIVSQSISF
ncbi:unnamed protein product [Mytilus edulis]|uniref:Uncharacterized protein n=1 Tax=Mytilus edulis TaxID=6550 RepID=A0A8S3SBL8_MYTED|nr:unnamed protein product [Mytilus edulis]